jgi:hypothetical protein
VELGKTGREFGTVDHFVGDRAQQFLGKRQLSGSDLGLVHLGLRGHELKFESESEDFGQLLLLENGLQGLDSQVRQFADVVFEPWLGEGNGDVKGCAFQDRPDNDRIRGVGRCGGDTNSLGLKLLP